MTTVLLHQLILKKFKS